MKFLIQHNLINQSSLLEISYAIEKYPHEYIGVLPFSHEITSENGIEGDEFIPYGSTTLTMVANELKWKGCHFDMDKFDYYESAKNRDDMLNAEEFLYVEDAISFLEKCPDQQQWFIRPTKDLKQFTGQCMDAKECREWLTDAMLCESSGSYKLERDTMVVLARPKNLQCEWRYFVIDGKVIDGSIYRYRYDLYKQHETDKEVLKEAQRFADKWLPNPCCCMDLVLVDDVVKVIEFNCINSSGFYDHDTKTIFEAWWKYHNR